MPQNSAVLFDVDGTLLDTNYLHIIAWSRAFREQGLQVPMAAIHCLIGMGSTKLMTKLIGRDDDSINEGHSRHYKELKGEVQSFEKASDLLKAVAFRGAQVVLTTSAKPEELEVILQRLDADEAISHVVSSGDVDKSKPDPDILELALEKAGVDAEQAVVIGDTVWDIEAAHRLGLICVAVTTGGIAREVLSNAGAIAVYESVNEIYQRLDSSLLAPFLMKI